MSVKDFIATHPVVVGIFLSGTKRWTDQLIVSISQATSMATKTNVNSCSSSLAAFRLLGQDVSCSN